MILTAPDDRSFPNAKTYQAGDEVDVDELATALGVDPGQLADDLIAQGWPEQKATGKKTTKTPKGDDTEGA